MPKKFNFYNLAFLAFKIHVKTDAIRHFKKQHEKLDNYQKTFASKSYLKLYQECQWLPY